jgi:hypothetical protein
MSSDRPRSPAKVQVLAVQVPVDLMERLRVAAARDGAGTVSPLVRRWLIQALAADERQAAAGAGR